MKKIRTKSTSLYSAITDPIILRETDTTRLIFKPLIVDNKSERKAAVKGSFVFQHKARGQEWRDYKELKLSELRATEWIKLELKSIEVLRLYDALTDLYELHQQAGVPIGERQFLRADKGLGALVAANEKELTHLLDRDPDNAYVLLSRLLQWISHISAPAQIVENLERLDISSLQQLNSIVGLSTLKSSYAIWEANQGNSNEEFWQTTLEKYSFVLSQIFSYPIVIVKGKAYVGGKSVTNKGGNLVDFLAKNEVSKNAVLIEIKTPTTSLLGTQYRGNVFNISKDLSGAIVQVLNYKHSLQSEYLALTQRSPSEVSSFEPACVVIVGNFKREMNDSSKAKSFELFRSHLLGIEVITYDELFGKVKLLIDLLEGRLTTTTTVEDKDDIPF